MAAIVPARTSGYVLEHLFGADTGICVIRFIVIQINTSINLGMDLRRQTFYIEMPMTFCFAGSERQPF